MMKQINAVLAASVATLLIGTRPATAQSIPTEALTKYEDFRQSMLKNNWHPVAIGNHGYNNYEEVTCGQTLCNAEWGPREGDRPLLNVTLYRENEELFVAPMIEWQ